MIEHTLRELLEDKVDLDVEGIDRLYLNAYQPRLQTGGGVVGFFKGHRGAVVASTTLMAPMSKAFVASIRAFAKRHDIDVVHFPKGQRKDDVTRQRLSGFQAREGVLYIGVAQEKFAALTASIEATGLPALFCQSDHGRLLTELGFEQDVHYCATPGVTAVVPIVAATLELRSGALAARVTSSRELPRPG